MLGVAFILVTEMKGNNNERKEKFTVHAGLNVCQ